MSQYIPSFANVRLLECRDYIALTPIPSYREFFSYGNLLDRTTVLAQHRIQFLLMIDFPLRDVLIDFIQDLVLTVTAQPLVAEVIEPGQSGIENRRRISLAFRAVLRNLPGS